MKIMLILYKVNPFILNAMENILQGITLALIIY